MKSKKYLLSFFISVLFFYLLFFKAGILNINQVDINISGVFCLDHQIAQNELNLFEKNILFIDEDKLTNKILEKFACVKSLSFKKVYPKKIAVDIEGKNGIGLVTSSLENLKDLEASPSSSAALLKWDFESKDGKKYLVDEKGYVFGGAKEEYLPTIFISSQDLRVGTQFDISLFEKINKVLTKSSSLELNISKLKVSENDLLVEGVIKVVFSQTKDILRQLASLQLILQKAKINGENMNIIDLRFDKPIITYPSKDK